VRYFLTSIWTYSYWRYALFSKAALRIILSAVGAEYLVINLLDTFGIYAKTQYTKYQIVFVLLFAVIFGLTQRLPVKRVRYKVPKRDISFEVRVGDILDAQGEIVISSNTTFDTDMSSGLIHKDSMQGQFALKIFSGNTLEIDKQLEESLAGLAYEEISRTRGKSRRYPMGTIAKVHTHGKNFYFVAMSHMNEYGNAETTLDDIDTALKSLWRYMSEQGELGDLVLPLMGTGRGRIELPRKKMVERIAQSFAYASREKRFSDKLIIVIYSPDADRSAINLFEIKDYLIQSLHV
jgi:Domain of unknown function (DUF6430)